MELELVNTCASTRESKSGRLLYWLRRDLLENVPFKVHGMSFQMKIWKRRSKTQALIQRNGKTY